MSDQIAFAPGRGSQLTPAERAEVQGLYLVEGKSNAEIARVTGRDRGTIAGVLKAADTLTLATELATEARDEVLQRLRRASGRLVGDWLDASTVAAARGDHRPARDALLHTGAIAPVPDGRHGGSARVQIVLGMPGRSIAPAGDVEWAPLVVDVNATSEDDG